jgi:hypothetical protein
LLVLSETLVIIEKSGELVLGVQSQYYNQVISYGKLLNSPDLKSKSADFELPDFCSVRKNLQIFELCRRVVHGWLHSADFESRQIFL